MAVQKLDHPQAWREVSEGVWKRPLAGHEPYFVFFGNMTASMCGGREHYTICSTIKVGSQLQVSALRQAWKRLRYEQPALACTVDASDMTMVYEVPNSQSLEQWLIDNFKVVETSKCAIELDHEPIQNATLYWLPQSSELIFRSPHWKIDGTGTMLLWHTFLTALGQPDGDLDLAWGSETKNLAPTMENIWNYSEKATAKQTEDANALLYSAISKGRGCGPPSNLGAGAASSGRCSTGEVVYDIKTTAAIVAASKAQNISVTAAIHAAFALATSRHADASTKNNDYVTFTQFNLRKYLGEPYNAAAVNLYYTPYPFTQKLPSGFGDVAKNMNTFYRGTFAPANLELNGHFLRLVFQTAQTPEYLGAPIPSDALVSSLGIAERYLRREYSNVRIEDFNLTVDIILGMSMLFIHTFNDRLRLTYCYNDGFQKTADIESILGSTKEILKQGLRLEANGY